MPPQLPDSKRVPPFLEVRQRVRRYRPTDLLPAVARVACHISEPDMVAQWSALSPWGLAALARESIVRGTEHRDPRDVSDDDVLALHNLFNRSYDWRPSGEKDASLGIRIRHAYEQFPYQESDAEELARTWALLQYALPATNVQRLTAADVQTLVGGPLQDVLRATWLLYGDTLASAGVWDEHWWSTADTQSLTTLTSSGSVIARAARGAV